MNSTCQKNEIHCFVVDIVCVALSVLLFGLSVTAWTCMHAVICACLHDPTGVVVIKPGCEGIGNSISVNSSILTGDPATSGGGGGTAVEGSAISLPPAIFGTMTNCTDVGVIVVISDGIGPLLSRGDLERNCIQPIEPLVHGRW